MISGQTKEGGGRGARNTPLDFKLGEYAGELKTLNTHAASQKTAIKAAEVARKQGAAREGGMKPLLVVQVVDMDTKTVKVYSWPDFESKAVSKMNPVGSYSFTEADFKAAQGATGHWDKRQQRADAQLVNAAAGVDDHPGDAERLREYWEHGEGGAQIGWGTPGDFDRCVVLVTEHAKFTDEQAKGYCNERHHGATGMWPSEHAKELRGAAGDDNPPTDPEAQPGDTVIELRNGVPWISTEPPAKPVKASKPTVPLYPNGWDVTDLLTTPVVGKFDPSEQRDPKTGKWLRDPAGHYLDEALKELGRGKMISHNGHEVDRSAKGYNVRFYKRESGKPKVKVGEPKTYEHPQDAAEAARRGKHLSDAELKHGESHIKPESGMVKLPKAPERKPPQRKTEPKPPTKEKLPGRKAPAPLAEDRARTLSAKPQEGHWSPLESFFAYEALEHGNGRGAFVVTSRSQKLTQETLTKYAKVPPEIRQDLAAHGTSFYIGVGGITGLDSLQGLANEHPNGYGKGETFKRVAGVTVTNNLGHSVIAIGGGRATYGDGSINVSAHEAAHALDDAHGKFSFRNEDFNAVYVQTRDEFGAEMRPYYIQKGTGIQGQKEFFAEAFATWAHTRDMKVAEQERRARMIMEQLGAIPRSMLAKDAKARNAKAIKLGTKMIAIFDKLLVDIAAGDNP